MKKKQHEINRCSILLLFSLFCCYHHFNFTTKTHCIILYHHQTHKKKWKENMNETYWIISPCQCLVVNHTIILKLIRITQTYIYCYQIFRSILQPYNSIQQLLHSATRPEKKFKKYAPTISHQFSCSYSTILLYVLCVCVCFACVDYR